MPQKVNFATTIQNHVDKRRKYPYVVTQQMKPDKRFNCNKVTGGKREALLPQS